MLSCLAACFALAQETVEIDNIKYYLDNGEATVAEQTEQLKGSIVIPETVTCDGEEYRVVELAASAFAYQTEITDVTLPNSVTRIGESCFMESSLQSITLPEGVTELPDYCFQYCNSLKSITLPEGLTKLGADCFSYSKALEEITLPESVKEVGAFCFYRCLGLKSVTLPENVRLGQGCFMYCIKVESLTVPSGTVLGGDCFGSCYALKSLTVDEGVTELADFAECTSLESVTLPGSIRSLGNTCFAICTSLKSITLPDGITELGDNCFSSCSSLESITIPVNVSSLGRLCFSRCTGLKTMTCQWESLDGIETEADAFDDVNPQAELHVPAGTAAEYQATEPWSSFKYIIEDGTVGVAAVDAAGNVSITTGDGLLTVSGLADGETATLYNAQGTMIASGKATAGSVSLDTNGTKGVVILKAGNKSLKVNLK